MLAQTGDDQRAWQEAFGAIPLEQLDQDLKLWIVEGKHRVLHFKVQFQSQPVQVRAISDADVYAIRAYMTYSFIGDRARVRSDLAAAQALEPQNPLAQKVAAALGR